jgi:hypothetical protein
VPPIRRLSGRRVLLVGLLGSVLLVSSPASAAPGAPWTVVPTPNTGGSLPNVLQGVAAISPADVWAVGTWQAPGQTLRGQTMHWDGTAWQVVPSPAGGMPSSVLTAVDATAPDNVWAVGHARGQSNKPLIMRYRAGVWSVVPSQAPGPSDHELNGVDMFEAGGWAVGTYRTTVGPGRQENLILRWTGSSWVQIPAPPGAGTATNVLKAVAADGPYRAWAVGYLENTGDPEARQTVILRWNGASWQRVPSPNPGTRSNSLNSVIALSPTDVWAVGFSFDQGPGGGYANRRPLALHWNGALWTVVPTPDPEALEYTDVAAVSSSEVYLVGYQGRVVDHDFITRWDGWQLVPEPVLLPPDGGPQPRSLIGSALFAVSAGAPGQVWAVGHLRTTRTQALRKFTTPAGRTQSLPAGRTLTTPARGR